MRDRQRSEFTLSLNAHDLVTGLAFSQVVWVKNYFVFCIVQGDQQRQSDFDVDQSASRSYSEIFEEPSDNDDDDDDDDDQVNSLRLAREARPVREAKLGYTWAPWLLYNDDDGMMRPFIRRPTQYASSSASLWIVTSYLYIRRRELYIFNFIRRKGAAQKTIIMWTRIRQQVKCS